MRSSSLLVCEWLVRRTSIAVALCLLSGAPRLDAATLRGDVDADGVVTMKDALAVLRHAEAVAALSEAQQTVADVWPNPGTSDNSVGDGQITREDAERLLRYIVGSLTAFELQSGGELLGEPEATAAQFIPQVPFPTPRAEDISVDPELGEYPVSRTRLVVVFADSATAAQANAALQSVGGRIVGGLSDYGVALVQIADSGDAAALDDAVATLEASPAVSAVMRDLVVVFPEPVEEEDTGRAATHPGAGMDVTGAGTSFSVFPVFLWTWEATPAGSNWGLEYIRMPQAWSLADRVDPTSTSVPVTVLDGGFDPSHPDLKVTVSPATPNVPNYHGTHVAGTIGATWDGPLTTPQWQKGIDGINPFASITGVRQRLGMGKI